ncbi:OLC1v1004415C1 [Oldenlandia corymbosa var. corymbosa]|uniref:OLC1v1004415C1 n=1 Tax=Oldenlandia corymbosa var. corymbosa TaxID=529605 RepID=A0AAV1DCH9_OLDCO|nr:OLC1v1004415C1 [Oldenlandia corymbosa var. corymbosa]
MVIDYHHQYSNSTMAVAPLSFSSSSSAGSAAGAGEKKHWWLTNKKMVDKYLKEAKILLASQDQSEIVSALNLLEAALTISPRLEHALELKARCLLHLRRYKDVADMLKDYIPSLKMAAAGAGDSPNSSTEIGGSSALSKEQVKLLSSSSSGVVEEEEAEPIFKCFSVSDLKKKVMASLCKNCQKEGQWRYLVLGQACSHLGLMEDAMVLLQTGKRLASAAFRRESNCWSDDSFFFRELPTTIPDQPQAPQTAPPKTEAESICHLLSHIKLLIRRKTAALAALDAGLYSEAIRHFSKILDGRRGGPQGFLAECYMHRALAYRSAGRIAEAIADCNKTLALDPSCLEALNTRATLFETVRCLPDSLHDLEHLKLLYNSILRDRKLPGPAWKRQNVQYREIPGKLCSLATKMQELKQRVASGETGNVDYHALIGLRRGCTRSELERAHLLLTLRHKPDKSSSFIDRCQFGDERDVESVRDRAKMSALLLYRLIQKGYTSVMTAIMDEEAVEKQRKKAAAALQAAQAQTQAQAIQVQQTQLPPQPPVAVVVQQMTNATEPCRIENKGSSANAAASASVFQGVFCRDLAVVGNLISQAGFNRPIPVKYEALSC